MQIQEIRKRNIQALIDAECGGKKNAFARRIDKDPSYVNRWFSEAGQARGEGKAWNVLNIDALCEVYGIGFCRSMIGTRELINTLVQELELTPQCKEMIRRVAGSLDD